MFSKLGPGEIILILVIALVIFGPSKLPELGRSLGKSIQEFKGAVKEVSGDAKSAVDDVKKTVADADPRN